MRTIQKISAGISFALCLVMVAPLTFAQGNSQAKKEANQAANDQQTGNNKQKGKSGQARDKSRQNGNTPQDPPAVLKREEGQGNADKVKKGNNGNRANQGNNRNDNRVDNDQEGEGNAYGKNKGNLSGREFGQQRAANARLTGEQRRERLENRIEDGDRKVRDARTRISRAREDLEKDRRDNKVTDAQYNEKKARIDRAERAVQVLEEKVNEGRALGSLQ